MYFQYTHFKNTINRNVENNIYVLLIDKYLEKNEN